MITYLETIKSNAETYKNYSYNEIPDGEAYIEMVLSYIRDINAASFLDWMGRNDYNHCLAQMFYESLKSISKQYFGQKMFSSNFSDCLLDFAKENQVIEADYELERDGVLRYDQDNEVVDNNYHTCLYDRG